LLKAIKTVGIETLLKKPIAWLGSATLEDKALQYLLSRHLSETGYAPANTLVADGGYSHAAVAVGTGINALTSYPKLYALEQAAPIVRALLLFLFYSFLPFGLVFSRYRLGALVTGGIFVFSLILWSYIWHLVQWLDQALIHALYGGYWFQHTPQALLADSIIGLLMVVAPIFWFTVMGTLGVNAGRGVDKLVSGMLGSAAATGAIVPSLIPRLGGLLKSGNKGKE
jgi:hypothetical protein